MIAEASRCEPVKSPGEGPGWQAGHSDVISAPLGGIQDFEEKDMRKLNCSLLLLWLQNRVMGGIEQHCKQGPLAKYSSLRGSGGFHKVKRLVFTGSNM